MVQYVNERSSTLTDTSLAAAAAVDCRENKIPAFMTATIEQLPLKDLPKWLQKILEGKTGVELMETALGAVCVVLHTSPPSPPPAVIDLHTQTNKRAL
jgi:hypothetical protein